MPILAFWAAETPMRIAAATLALSVFVGSALLTLAGPAAAQENTAEPERKTLRERLLERRQSRAAAEKSGSPANNDPGPTRIEGPGDFRFTLEHGGLTRMYRVHVPKSYDAAKPMPMLMAFHGGGANMDYQADDKYYGLISKSESAGFIAVFPNGYSKRDGGKLASWNAGNCCAGARDDNIDDVGFVRKMIERLRGQLNIAEGRIYATGMSNGALFSYRLACEMSETVRAIASVAGSDGMKICTPKRPVAILEIHAKDDEFVLFDGGAGKKLKILADFVSVPETISRWVQRNGCSPTPKRVLENKGAYCESYSSCREGTEVKLCVTERGGHSWPGGIKVRTNEPGSTALSANDVMWEFFSRH